MSFNILKLHFSIIFRTAKIHFSIKTAKQITKKMRKKTVSQSNFRHVNQYLTFLHARDVFWEQNYLFLYHLYVFC